MSQQPPGWYYAQGDPPGTVRYWDGEIWTGEPVASPNTGFAGPQSFYREASQATLALVLSIAGFVVCQILCPIGWNIAQKELDAIDAGLRDPSNRGTAQAGKIIGIIGTVLMVLAIVLIVVLVIVAASSEGSF